MTTPHDEYQSPLVTRYASPRVRKIFSARHRIEVWRELWIWLATAEAELGLDIRPEQLAALSAARHDIDFDKAADYERRFRHDVMAHVHTFGDAAPEARGVIHLGATSCFVTDNADALLLREGLVHTRDLLVSAIEAVAGYAERSREIPCLAYTHFQPAQPTTHGKRACLWLQDLLEDLSLLEGAITRVPFRGAKGTTGTQASFLTLFEGDAEKCEALDRRLAELAGFLAPVPVSGQTYPRKFDHTLVSVLSGIALSCHRFANDVRLLSGVRELAEPFEKEQIGSSAMAYKQNPMRTERITSLARHVMALSAEAGTMAANQWLERTLDDSAGRRIFLPEAFLAVDAILQLVVNVASGLVVNDKVARARLMRELPFMATEEILMRAVKAGGDRQVLHEQIRQHSLAAKEGVLAGADRNDLMDRIGADEHFAAVRDELEGLLVPERFVGLAPRQVRRFLDEHVTPALAPYAQRERSEVEIRV